MYLNHKMMRRRRQSITILGIAENRIRLPQAVPPGQLEAGVPVTDTEDPGMGAAMGAAVGGAMGAPRRCNVGLWPCEFGNARYRTVIAFGMVGAGVAGVVGAAAGSAVGDQVEEELGEGIPHEDIYLYEDALRHGHSIHCLRSTKDQADQAEEAIECAR